MDPLTIAGVGALALASKPAQDVLCKMLENVVGPLTKDWGENLAQKMRDRRQQRLEKTARQSGELIVLSGREVVPIPSKLLLSLLEGCSVEDDDSMSEMWSRLLASAAVGSDVHPAYPRILEELTPFEAKLLNEFDPNLSLQNPEGVGHPSNQHKIALGNLLRIQLTHNAGWYKLHDRIYLPGLTDLGWDFVAQCRGPGWTWESYRSPTYAPDDG